MEHVANKYAVSKDREKTKLNISPQTFDAEAIRENGYEKA